MDDSEWPDRSGPDVTSAEIAEWTEEDFGRAVAEGMANAVDGDEPADEHELVAVEILNHEWGEVVGTIDTNRSLDTENESLRSVSEEYLKKGVPASVPLIYENKDGKTAHVDGEVMVDPRTRGFVRAFVDELPNPFGCELEALTELQLTI